jgi:SAM-dependent methyltransferase
MGAIGWICAGLALNEFAAMQARNRQRYVLFFKALVAARCRQKPLLVIGRPDGWTSERTVRWGDTLWAARGAHPCGDYTVDVRPQGNARCICYVQTSAEDLSMFPDGFFGAVYSSCTLEHIPDLPKAWKEITRVASKPVEVFCVHPQPWSLFAWLFPHHRWAIRGIEEGTISVRRI